LSKLKLLVFVARVTQHQLLSAIFDAIGLLIQHLLVCSACGMPLLLETARYGGSVLFVVRLIRLPQTVDVVVDTTEVQMVSQMAHSDSLERK
jgi:hypothetical protein